jgi:hypothetical protein
MKFATYKNGTRDGRLLVVSRDLKHAIDAAPIAPTNIGPMSSRISSRCMPP